MDSSEKQALEQELTEIEERVKAISAEVEDLGKRRASVAEDMAALSEERSRALLRLAQGHKADVDAIDAKLTKVRHLAEGLELAVVEAEKPLQSLRERQGEIIPRLRQIQGLQARAEAQKALDDSVEVLVVKLGEAAQALADVARIEGENEARGIRAESALLARTVMNGEKGFTNTLAKRGFQSIPHSRRLEVFIVPMTGPAQ